MSEHGYVRYTHGCRCEVCRAAKATYIREKRAAARAYAGGGGITEQGRNFVPEIKRGIYGYQERMCRCDVCMEAMRAACRRQYAAKRKATADSP